MQFSLFSLLTSRQYDMDALVMMRGETYLDVVEDGEMLVLVVVRGAATISRSRAGEQPSFHMTSRPAQPMFITTPGTYCVVARDHILGVRAVRRAGRRKP